LQLKTTMWLRLHDHVIMKHISGSVQIDRYDKERREREKDRERERERERAECLLRGKSIFHSCFSHVAIKLTRSNMSVVSFVGKYVWCVCVCVCICCIHCANFSNLNRQFQSIATAYRFRHEFYFLLPSIAAFQQSRAGKTLQTEQ